MNLHPIQMEAAQQYPWSFFMVIKTGHLIHAICTCLIEGEGGGSLLEGGGLFERGGSTDDLWDIR